MGDKIQSNESTAQGQEESAPIGNGGQAFPCAGYDGPDSREDSVPGMTLRDYFAAKAMAALIVDPARADQSRKECARLSYLMADAMLKARGGAS